MNKPCEYCGCDLPLGVDKGTRRVRSFHFASCKARPAPAPMPLVEDELGYWQQRAESAEGRYDALLKAIANDVALTRPPPVVLTGDLLPGMSPLNRQIAYTAAAKLRELGYEWDGSAWAPVHNLIPNE